MRVLKVISILVFVVGVAALAIVYAPALQGQRADRAEHRDRHIAVLPGGGASIGVSVRDADRSTKDTGAAGVIVEDVRPGSPADTAGVKAADVVAEFDGERVRSARQFARLVDESVPDRPVKAVVVRDGRRVDLQITPEDRTAAWMNRERLHERLGDLEQFADRLPFAFDFDWDWGGMRGRLGVTVQELPTQLAAYFGVKSGVLVSSVADGSAAQKAGIKAGDVITAVDGSRVTSREELSRLLRAAEGDVTIGVTRDRKELSLKATIESPRRPTTSRPA